MAEVAPAHPAATVVLLRDTAEGLQTWLLRRVPQMAFAAEMSVFPGGRIDDSDRATDIPWVGEEPVALAERFGSPVEEVRASLVAAARETFEETGVLVTSPAHAGNLAALTALRHAVEQRHATFGSVLVDAGLAIDATLIGPWARWITPVARPRRFDTYFYVAALPEGAVAQADSGEASHADWIKPADALAEYDSGQRPLMPPTVRTLQELLDFDRVTDVLAAAPGRDLEAILPRAGTDAAGRAQVTLPDGSVIGMSAR